MELKSTMKKKREKKKKKRTCVTVRDKKDLFCLQTKIARTVCLPQQNLMRGEGKRRK